MTWRAEGVAVVVVNALDGSKVISRAFSKYAHEQSSAACTFDVRKSRGSLGRAIRGHKAALIIDATLNGTAKGTVSIVDLGTTLVREKNAKVRSVNGIFVADELRLLTDSGELPSRIILLGIELSSSSSQTDKKLRQVSIAEDTKLVLKLSELIGKAVDSIR